MNDWDKYPRSFIDADKLNEMCDRVIYLLKDHDQKVVYVGQSEYNVFSRIASHLKNKQFESVELIHIPENQDLSYLEGMAIVKYTPKYNKTLPTVKGYLKLSEAIDRFSLSAKKIKRLIFEYPEVQVWPGRLDEKKLRDVIEKAREEDMI